MGRKPCCEKEGLNRGAWTAQEDKILSDYIQAFGEGKWNSLPRRAGLKRCGKSCRLRWLNYLRPDIKRGNITGDEEDLIVRLHKLLGNRWSLIAGRLPGRTDNEIKNYWNTNLSKKLELEATQKLKLTNSKQPQDKKTLRLMEVRDSEAAKSVPIKTTAFKCTKNFSIQEAQLIGSRPVGTGSNQDQDHDHDHDQVRLIPSDESCKGYFSDFNTKFGFGTDLDPDQDGLFFTSGVQEVKETEFADDFNFLNELLDSEGGWIGDL